MALLTSGIPSLETFCLNTKTKPVHSTAQTPAPYGCLEPLVPHGVKFWQSASQLLAFLLQVGRLQGRSGTSRDPTALLFQQLQSLPGQFQHRQQVQLTGLVNVTRTQLEDQNKLRVLAKPSAGVKENFISSLTWWGSRSTRSSRLLGIVRTRSVPSRTYWFMSPFRTLSTALWSSLVLLSIPSNADHRERTFTEQGKRTFFTFRDTAQA